MPCRDDYGPTPSVVYRDDPDTKKLVETQKQKIDLLTRLLCFVMTNGEELDLLSSLADARKTVAHGDAYNELVAWWKAHRLEDERERKRLRKAALAKLTPEEKEALGLD